MNKTWRVLSFAIIMFVSKIHSIEAQDEEDEMPAAPPPDYENCNGIFLSYEFVSREKEFPRVKNATAQAWAFKSLATILNAGTTELEAWRMYIGFQHDEILVSASGAVLLDSDDFPAPVGNGTYLSGSPQTDLKTSIDTAGDLTQIQAQIEITGTQFGVKPPKIPMPKTIRLANDGFKCPAPIRKKRSMHLCCIKNQKFKAKKNITTKFLPRQEADLSISYDIIQAYESNYLVEVTLENKHSLGRLDHWNLTFEWMRGEFIYTMRGAYTHKFDATGCIYGTASTFYNQLDFSKVMNCEKKPIISDLPPDRANDTEYGKIPFCCRNGSLLPTTMDESKSKSIFQMQVYKLPPGLNPTAIYPPEKWKIKGILNPDYKCGSPIRVDPTEFPVAPGLDATKSAIATWQIVCNISRATNRKSRCCVSFSAYFNESIIPCNTCACGCDETEKCNPNAPAMLLPSEAILLPFENRTQKAKAWASIKKFKVPKPLPCGDNCGVSINWHLYTDYKGGWTSRITLFNWGETIFENWFVGIQLNNKASKGYEKAYSFNGTLLRKVNNTIFLQGLVGLNFLIAETKGANPKSDPRVPGKQQSVISFKKSKTPGINVAKRDGYPSRVYFNGEECSLPMELPINSGSGRRWDPAEGVVIWILVFVMIHLKW